MEESLKRKELRHDRHTVSLLTDHLVITPKYRGKILTGEVSFITVAIIRSTCAEMSIKIIDIAVNTDHVHIFFQYPPKYSVSAITALLDRAGKWWRNIFPHRTVLTMRKIYRQKTLSSPVSFKYGVW